MKKNTIFLTFLLSSVTILLLLLTGCMQEQHEKQLNQAELVERGKFLVQVGGCSDCHTPKISGPQWPQMDTKRLLSGYASTVPLQKVNLEIIKTGKWILFTQDLTAAVGPWGASFAANLTPDNETGIGTWQKEMFANAMRTG